MQIDGSPLDNSQVPAVDNLNIMNLKLGITDFNNKPSSIGKGKFVMNWIHYHQNFETSHLATLIIMNLTAVKQMNSY